MCVHTAILISRAGKYCQHERIAAGLQSQFLDFSHPDGDPLWIITFEDESVVRFYRRLQLAITREDIISLVHVKNKEHLNLMPLFHKEDNGG